MMAGHRTIAIHAVMKTGSSALFYKILEALPPSTDRYFEPDARAAATFRSRMLRERLHLRQRRTVLVKFLPFQPHYTPVLKRFGAFDREILIVRDPRDQLVSRLLYQPFNSELCRDEAAMLEFLNLIRAKEANPSSISLAQLFEPVLRFTKLPHRLEDYWQQISVHSITEPMAFHDGRPDLFVFRYEDLVAERFAVLGDYLGLTLQGPAVVEQGLQRVVRTKGTGDWKNWFLPSDMEFFGPALRPYMDRYYPDADWTPSPGPVIPSATASRFVLRNLMEKRREYQLPPLAIDLDAISSNPPR